jgi:hypothetical protein
MSSTPRQPGWRWGLWAALVLALLPLIVAFVESRRDDWRPIGDDAVIATLTHDVLSTRTPLLGMPSTVVTDDPDDTPAHPGPLEFWVLAVPERVAGAAGLNLGAFLVNASAIVLLGLVAARVGGRAAGVGLLVLASVLAWTLGRQLVVDIWNPHIAVYPLLALLVVTWAAVAGRVKLLWVVALLASFVAQAHLLYVPIALACGLAALAAMIFTFVRRARRAEEWRRDALVGGGATLGVLLIAWSFPIYQQLTNSPGNFVAMQETARSQQETAVGFGFALRTLVQAVGIVPLFLRQANSYSLVNKPWNEIGVLTIVTAFVVILALLVVTVLAFRRRDRVAAAAGVVALLALVVATITFARLPEQPFDVARYRVLEMLIVGAFVWFATIFGAVRALPATVTERPALQWTAIAGAAVILVAMPFATASADSFDRNDPHMQAAVVELARQTEARLDKTTPYVIDLMTQGGLFGSAAKYGVIRELQARGFDIGVYSNDFYLDRSHTAPNGAKFLTLVTGDLATVERQADFETIASVTSATDEDRARLTEVDEDLREYLRNNDDVRAVTDPNVDPITLVKDGTLAKLWSEGKLKPSIFFSGAYKRYVAAHDLVDQYIFKMYVPDEPLKQRPRPGA